MENIRNGLAEAGIPHFNSFRRISGGRFKYRLAAKVVKDGRIVGYDLIDETGKSAYVTKENAVTNINTIENCCNKKGYLALKPEGISCIPVRIQNDANMYPVITVTDADKLSATASKGDQSKWKKGNKWIKTDTQTCPRQHMGDMSAEIALRKLKYEPFGNKQVDALQKLFPTYKLRIDKNRFDCALSTYQNSLYTDLRVSRAIHVLKRQLQKYEGKIWTSQ